MTHRHMATKPMKPHDIRQADRKRLAALFDFAVEPDDETAALPTSTPKQSAAEPARLGLDPPPTRAKGEDHDDSPPGARIEDE